MNQEFNLDLEKARQEGLAVSLGRRMSSGELQTVSGPKETADIVSDPVRLSKCEEVEIKLPKGLPSLFLLASMLLAFRQVFFGYAVSGFPIFLGLRRVLEAHMLFLGPSRTGKTTGMANVFRQLIRHGIFCLFIGLKDFDPTIVAAGRDGANAKTRFDANFKPCCGKFVLITKQPGLPSAQFNFLRQLRGDIPPALQIAQMLAAMGFDPGTDNMSDKYYIGSSQDMLLKVPLGKSFKELDQNIRKGKFDKDTLYSTAAARHIISQQAALEIDLPEDHPASVSLAKHIKDRDTLYLDCCYQDNGHLALANGGLMAKAAISAKNVAAPGSVIAMFIDESQQFPQPLLTQILAQCASRQIRVFYSFHNLGQMGTSWEVLSMAGTRVIYGAVPGGSTDEHLQRLFGMKKEYVLNVGDSFSSGTSSSVTVGKDVSVTTGESQSQSSQYGFTEKESFAWSPNDTLELNAKKDRFIIQTPDAELAQWGGTAIVGETGGRQISFDDIERLTKEALNDTTHTIGPKNTNPAQKQIPELSKEVLTKREHFLSILNAAAAPRTKV
jgi:hypothetical protein